MEPGNQAWSKADVLEAVAAKTAGGTQAFESATKLSWSRRTERGSAGGDMDCYRDPTCDLAFGPKPGALRRPRLRTDRRSGCRCFHCNVLLGQRS